jgi:hypothetical protein
MTLKELKAYYRNSYIFQQETGMSRINWVNWARAGYIPTMSQLRLERATMGRFKYDKSHVPEGR